MGHSELHNEWADSNIVGVLTTAGTVVLWPGLCFADDAARISNSALQAAERLAWLRNWSAALPYYGEAEREFTASGDRRNALFAHISGIRAELQRLPLLETSELLANELENPLVQSDTALRLRCLIVKGDVDLDLDTELARRDWTRLQSVAWAPVNERLALCTKCREELLLKYRMLTPRDGPAVLEVLEADGFGTFVRQNSGSTPRLPANITVNSWQPERGSGAVDVRVPIIGFVVRRAYFPKSRRRCHRYPRVYQPSDRHYGEVRNHLKVAQVSCPNGVAVV